jgi:hypothetical protein
MRLSRNGLPVSDQAAPGAKWRAGLYLIQSWQPYQVPCVFIPKNWHTTYLCMYLNTTYLVPGES